MDLSRAKFVPLYSTFTNSSFKEITSQQSHNIVTSQNAYKNESMRKEM